MELSWTMCKECSLSVPRMSVPLHRQDLIIYIYQIWLYYNGTQSGAKIQMSKKCTPLWREAHFQVKMYKTHHSRATFGSWDVEKVHAVVARSTFPSQNVQNTTCSRHFWKFGCWKSARRCDAKHIWKSKCTKHTSAGPLLEVAMSKKCTPLWREAHFEVKMFKTLGVRTTFGGSDVASLQYTTLPATLDYTTLQYTTFTLHYAPVHFTTLNYTTPHYITLNDTATQIDS